MCEVRKHVTQNKKSDEVGFPHEQPPQVHIGGRPSTKPGDHGTLNAHNRWFILFYHVWEPAWIECHWNSIWLKALSHMTSHYTWGSMTTLHDFGGFLGQPLDTFFWALTISWSRSWLVCEGAFIIVGLKFLVISSIEVWYVALLGHFSLHKQIRPLHQIGSCVILLAIMNHVDWYFECKTIIEMHIKLQEVGKGDESEEFSIYRLLYMPFQSCGWFLNP